MKQDALGTIRKIADIGYAAIEGGVPSGVRHDEFKKFLDDSGIHLSSTWAWPNAENVGELVETANFFGYRHVINGFGADQLKTREQIRQAGDRLKASADLLAPHGLTFCVHNHAWEFDRLDGELVYDLLLDAAGPDVAIELDLYWASNYGQIDVPGVVSKYKSRTPLLHVKDGPLVKGQPNTAVGSGQFDVTAAVQAADPGVLKYLVVELDNYVAGNDQMMDAVRDSYQWLTQSKLGSGRK